ncbi:MAG: RteC domain-containing protein [Tannerellaceae bacterium]
MTEFFNDILNSINSKIELIDIYGSNVIEESMNLILIIQKAMTDCRSYIGSYSFSSREEEVFFFKEQKPELLSKLLYFNKIFQIESKFPNGSDNIASNYLHNELDSLTYFFNRNLDFYQYYRSKSTIYDEYYFIRGKGDLRLNSDSSSFNHDPKFSTGYDFKIAKILAYEMLRIYLNKRLQNIGKERELEELRSKYVKSPMKFTGKKVALVELGYALANSGDINNGHVDIKEMMDFLGSVFNVDMGDYYRTYIAIKDRKKDRTAYLSKLIEMLERKMDNDDSQ